MVGTGLWVRLETQPDGCRGQRGKPGLFDFEEARSLKSTGLVSKKPYLGAELLRG